MQFTSYAFFGFLFMMVILYYLIPGKYRWWVLLAGSMSFYVFGDWRYLLYIVTTISSTFLITNAMDRVQSRLNLELSLQRNLTGEEKKIRKEASKRKKRHLLTIGLILNFSILAVVKYTGFVMSCLPFQHLLNFSVGQTGFLIPLGISFYTFQTMGYAIDVYRNRLEVQKNPFRLALFVSFFPQLIQGPISRYRELSTSLFQEHPFSQRNLERGIGRILYGYFKKLVLADRVMPAVKLITGNPDSYNGIYIVIGMLLYACQLYADFTGGIDIAIGAADLFGVSLAENFNRPFFSKSIKEYWKRWHITLGTWFTDYVFYPVSVSKPMLKLSRKSRKLFSDAVGKRIPVYLASILVWLLTGIWHGASWNFVVWGLCNCAVMLISQELEPVFSKLRPSEPVRLRASYRLFQIVRTFFLLCLFRTFDCYKSVSETFTMWGRIFCGAGLQTIWKNGVTAIGLSVQDLIIVIMGVFILLGVSLSERKGISIFNRILQKNFRTRAFVWILLFFIILVFGTYGPGYEAAGFIYNRY